MTRIEALVRAYEDHVRTPWGSAISGAERVWMVVYDKEQERRLRMNINEFEHVTRRAKRGWRQVDCTGWFADWLTDDEYRDAWFDEPEMLGLKLQGEFREAMAGRLRDQLDLANENEVVGLIGVASFYGLLRVSDLIHSVERSVKGRLAVFFPGTKNGSNYRLLDARDGWNYLAQAIVANGSRGGR